MESKSKWFAFFVDKKDVKNYDIDKVSYLTN